MLMWTTERQAERLGEWVRATLCYSPGRVPIRGKAETFEDEAGMLCFQSEQQLAQLAHTCHIQVHP